MCGVYCVLLKQISFTGLSVRSCYSRAELGDGLGALGDGVLGELSGEEKTDGGLDLTGGEGVLLVVANETG